MWDLENGILILNTKLKLIISAYIFNFKLNSRYYLIKNNNQTILPAFVLSINDAKVLPLLTTRIVFFIQFRKNV